MTNKKQAMIDAFKEKEQIEEQEFSLIRRADDAEEKIVELQEEAEELKKKRPKLLADCKDISKLNKRLKEIDEEIEIQKDTIIGVNEKRENMKDEIYNKKCRAQKAFQDYINEILTNIGKKYMKIATKLAEIITEYITLESICNGRDIYVPKIKYNDISRLPNLNNSDKPIFKYEAYEIWKANHEKLNEKYEIPNYQVENISRY